MWDNASAWGEDEDDMSVEVYCEECGLHQWGDADAADEWGDSRDCPNCGADVVVRSFS
jgi:hypothetical protein